MVRQIVAAVFSIVVLLGMPGISRAQAPAAAAGHWEGAIELPDQAMKIEVDLASTDGKWRGTISIPSQNLKGFPLGDVTAKGETVSFALKGVPGDPQFQATLAKDGKAMAGQLTQGGATMPFKLTRTGEPRFDTVPKSTAITKEFEGTWEGALEVQGKTLRLVVKLASQPAGAASGTLISVDQGGGEIPIGAVVQEGMHLTLLIPTIGGSYEGDLKDGQIAGTWKQGAGTLPLTLKRAK